MFRRASNLATTGVHYFTENMCLSNRIAISYMNMHIFYVPDGQQPSYEAREMSMFRMAICCVNMHISMFQMASNPATRPGKFLNVPDGIFYVKTRENKATDDYQARETYVTPGSGTTPSKKQIEDINILFVY